MAAYKRRRTTDSADTNRAGADTNRAGPDADSSAGQLAVGVEIQFALCCVALLRPPVGSDVANLKTARKFNRHCRLNTTADLTRA